MHLEILHSHPYLFLAATSFSLPSSSSSKQQSAGSSAPPRGHHGARRLSPSSAAAAGSCLLQRAGTAGPPSSPSPSPWRDASAPCPPLHGRELHFPWMAPRIFPAPPTAPFFPKIQEQPLPFSLQRPIRFSSSRLPFFTWPNTAPCPWMQQQQPPLLPHKTAAPDPLQIACFVRSAQSRPTPSCWCLGQLHAASSLCAVRPSTRLTSSDLRSAYASSLFTPGDTATILVRFLIGIVFL